MDLKSIGVAEKEWYQEATHALEAGLAGNLPSGVAGIVGTTTAKEYYTQHLIRQIQC